MFLIKHTRLLTFFLTNYPCHSTCFFAHVKKYTLYNSIIVIIQAARYGTPIFTNTTDITHILQIQITNTKGYEQIIW